MNHYKTTLNYFDNRSTNASAESVNSNSLNPLNDPGEDGATLSPTNLNAQDVFGYSLHYFDHDFSGTIGGNNNFIANQANSTLSQNSSQLYNGNIGCMITTIINPNTREILPLGNAYRYDQLNRLSSAVSFKNLDLQSNSWQTGGAPSFANSFNYDANGNILKQIRKDEANNEIDNLTYHYETFLGSTEQRNRLAYVEDASSNSDINELSNQLVGNYKYDFEGRLIHDKIEEIDQIYWRVDGKIKKIKRTANSQKKNITFDYDAMGHRIAKHVYTSKNVWEKSTYYVLDAQGNTMAVYQHANDDVTHTITFSQTEKHIYGSSRLGTNNKAVPMFGSQNATYSMRSVRHHIGKRTYELSNHLGNVLSIISDKVIPHDNNGTVDYYMADIRHSQDYSPFGVTLHGRDLSLSTTGNKPYRYSFQNQEHDDEIKGEGNSVNFEYRMHDPRLGRFFAIDPLTRKYPHNSPYVFSENVVINAVELEGLERSYVFNSAYLSSLALTVIKTGTFKEIKQYLDEQVGTKFSNPKNLKYAKEKLGDKFDNAPGYNSKGTAPLDYGDRAVKGGKQSNADYFYVRLVIDNGDGTWSTQSVKIFNPQYIQRKIAEVDSEIKTLESDLEALKKSIKNDEEWVNSNEGIINTSDSKEAVEEAFFRLGQEAAKTQTRWNIPKLKYKAKQMAKQIAKLKEHKEYLENMDNVQWGKTEKVKTR